MVIKITPWCYNDRENKLAETECKRRW